jgi:restriction endonuclease Mrr
VRVCDEGKSLSGVFRTIGRWVGRVTGRTLPRQPDPRVERQPSPNLARRNQDIISRYLDRISTEGRRYHVDNTVRDCIGEIAAREGKKGLVPKYGEWLSQWRTRADIPGDFRDLEQQVSQAFQARLTWLADEKAKRAHQETEAAGQRLMQRNLDLIEKFVEITERKVSILDDYGDENLKALPEEITICIHKIAEREGQRVSDNPRRKSDLSWRWRLPREYQWLEQQLQREFMAFHEALRSTLPDEAEVRHLSGEEFEAYIAKLLRSQGYEVVGTPRTGDQGADLIAKKDGRKIVIQAKRYQGVVGNRAVQEVIAAVQFYGGTEGWVVTNSTFTASAKALAQKSNIKLIRSADI